MSRRNNKKMIEVRLFIIRFWYYFIVCFVVLSTLVEIFKRSRFKQILKNKYDEWKLSKYITEIRTKSET